LVFCYTKGRRERLTGTESELASRLTILARNKISGILLKVMYLLLAMTPIGLKETTIPNDFRNPVRIKQFSTTNRKDFYMRLIRPGYSSVRI
jgi:hypothetical protein